MGLSEYAGILKDAGPRLHVKSLQSFKKKKKENLTPSRYEDPSFPENLPWLLQTPSLSFLELLRSPLGFYNFLPGVIIIDLLWS